MKVENRHPNCIYKHDPRQMPKVKETISHSSTKRNKKCGDDPKLDVHKKDTTRVMSFFEYQKCVEHANLDSEDLEGSVQYLFVLNFLNKLWVRCGNFFDLKLQHITSLAPMYGPFPMSEGSESYDMDYKAINMGLKSLLVKTKTDTYFSIGSWNNRYFIMCAIGTFARKLLWELHHEQNEMTWKEFMEVDENGNSPYHNYKVLTASADAIQRKIVEKELLLGIDRTKTRHFRKYGMTLAQIMGIVKDAVTWLSGHINERCNKSYFSSLSGPAMKYNAGFFETPKETYYVPRARILLPEVEGWVWLQKLGPFLVVFRTSVERMGGEAHCAEIDFVNELLPQLLLVALQDGVYFVGDVKYCNKP
jgi:hypothetical protein